MSLVTEQGAHSGAVLGVPFNCSDTGVTQISGCSAATFYFTSTGTKTYNTNGGPGSFCSDGTGVFLLPYSTTGTVPFQSLVTFSCPSQS